jgi:hypothetical protein
VASVSAETIAGIAAIVLSAVTSWPQAWRAWRHGTKGVSSTALVGGIVTMVVWTAYTAREGDTAALVATLFVLTGWVATYAALLHRRAVRAQTTAIAVVCVAGAAVASSVGAVGVVGVVAMLGSLGWAIPQAVRARSGELGGVSLATWVLLVAENLSWVVYGAVSEHWVYMPGSAWQLCVAAYVAWRVLAHRTGATASQAADPVSP